jgi:hypothetical protein
MPHASLKLIPGVDVNKTPALNEMAISDCQFIRFIPDRNGYGLVQKLGGWQKFYPNAFPSTIKAMHPWQDTLATKHLGIGMIGLGPFVITNIVGNGTTVVVTYTGSTIFAIGQEIELYGVNPSAYDGHFTVTAASAGSVSFASATMTAYVSGGFVTGAGNSLSVITNNTATDITPQIFTDNVPVKFITVAGDNEITITDTGSNIDDYDAVYIETDVSVGGIVIKGQYRCFAVGPNTFSIYATDILGNPLPATFSTVGAPIAITNASGTGTVATLTYVDAYTFFPGDGVTISGMNPAGYDGTYVLTASTAGGTVSYSNTTTAAFVSGGTIANYGVVSKFETSSGSPIVTVTLPFHGYSVGDVATFLVSTTVGGITIYGEYSVLSVISDSQYTISGSNQATSVASSYINGGEVRLRFYNGIGPLPPGTGYGVGPYGGGGYGTGIPPIAKLGVPINATDWSLDNWGEALLANPLNGPIYVWSPNASDPVALVIPNAPPVNRGMFVAMPQRQIIAYGSTFTGIQDPLLIRWCDVNNYNDWIGTTVNQAGSYRLPKGSEIIGGLQGPQQGLIWTDLALWAMQYTGPQYIYSFNEISAGCGLIAQKAAGILNNRVYWMSQSQFFVLTGSGVDPVPCPVWDVIFQDIDMDYIQNIRCAPNSRFGEISWYYPTIGSNGIPTKYVKLNSLLGQWDYGTLTRTAWINQSIYGPPIGSGGDNYIYQHEMGQNADTEAMNSYFQTGYFAMSEADVKVFVDQIWPDMKWGYYGGTQNVTVNMSFYVTDYAGQTPLVYGPYQMTQQTTFITPRFRGRLVSIRLESDDFDTFWRIGNIRYRLQQDGRF